MMPVMCKSGFYIFSPCQDGAQNGARGEVSGSATQEEALSGPGQQHRVEAGAAAGVARTARAARQPGEDSVMAQLGSAC